MRYAVHVLRSAQKQLAGIDRGSRPRVLDAIRALGDDPRPPGSKKLTGRPAWRIRVGSFRVIYEIHDDRSTVLIVTVGHRSDVYRRR